MTEHNGHEVRDSKEILPVYGHPSSVGAEGQGMYVMLHRDGKLSWSPSGNNMRQIHERQPEAWLTGPIFLPMSREDYERFITEFRRACDNY